MRKAERMVLTTRRIALAAIAATALVLTGCGDKTACRQGACHTEQFASEAGEPTTVVVEEGVRPTPPAPRPAVRGGAHRPQPMAFKIHRPLTRAELEAIYTVDPASVTPVTVAAAPAPAPAAGTPVQYDPVWNVKLTRTWSHIVIHHSAGNSGSAASFHKYHLARGWDGLGYHFVIGNGSESGDGEVEVGYRWKKQQRGAHAGVAEYNEHGVGICLVGNFEESGPSAAQMRSLRNLVAFLQSHCNVSTGHVIGHSQVPGKSTQCPGRHFDMASFKSSLSGASPVAVRSAGGTTASKPATSSGTGGWALP